MLTLYQFPISHYCEKVRWALDHKKLEYDVKNLLPGLHSLKTEKLAKRSSVPVLVDEAKVIQGSSDIITYLDEISPQISLTPKDSELKNEVMEWEKYLDEEIGVHLRRCCYHILLEHPNIVIPFFTDDGPWYGKYILPFMFPKLKIKMRALMNINEETTRTSRQQLGVAIDKLHLHLQNNKFLVGDKFTRADLAAASLLAPLCMPEQYDLNWPSTLPDQLQELIDEFQGKIDWVDTIYSNYR
jgi:glutathione S-transferase